MAQKLKAERTPREIENEKIYGPWLQFLYYVKFPLHALSFALAFSYFMGIFTGQSEVMGISLSGAGYKIAVTLSVGTGLLVEYAHGTFPPIFNWLLLNLRETFRNKDRIVLLFLSAGAIAAITALSLKSSEGGGRMAAKDMYEAPAPTDISSQSAAYRSDSARIANAAELQARSIMDIAKGEARTAKARYNKTIDEAENNLRIWKGRYADSGTEQDRHNVNGWKAKLSSRKREAQAAHDAEIDKGKAEAAKVTLAAGQQVSGYSMEFASYRMKTDSTDHAELVTAQAENKDLQDFAGGVGFWVVLVIFGCSFLRQLLLMFCGYEPPGATFTYPKNWSRFWSATMGIFSDKTDHSIARLEATRKHLQVRNEARAFAWPSGRLVLIGSSVVGMLFFVVQTFIYTESQYTEARIVPFPYNWAGLILFVVVTALGVRKNAKERDGGDKVATALPTTKPASSSSAKLSAIPSASPPVVPTTAPTVSASPSPILPKAAPTTPAPAPKTPTKTTIKPKAKPAAKLTTTSSAKVAIALVETGDKPEIIIDDKSYTPRKAADRISKFYKQSKTAARKGTRESNRLRYEQCRDATTTIFSFEEAGDTVSITQL